MPLKDQITNYARNLTEDKPEPVDLAAMRRARKPMVRHFTDDGIVPNHPRFPLLIYRRVVSPRTQAYDLATILDALFSSNGWGRSWRDTVYDFVHYHSQIHEVMGVARGTARIECGGIKGLVLSVNPGDVLILPAGTGHRLIEASRAFLVVGAYPESGTYDECTDTRERPDAIKPSPRCESRPRTRSMARMVRCDAFGARRSRRRASGAKRAPRNPATETILALYRPPMVRLFLVVQMPDPGDMRRMAGSFAHLTAASCVRKVVSGWSAGSSTM